jgi:hypothetical protein
MFWYIRSIHSCCFCSICFLLAWVLKQKLDYTEGTIKKGQSRDTGTVGYTRRRKTKQKHNTICAEHHHTETNTVTRIVLLSLFTTTYGISAYHHWCCEFESRSGRGVQHYVIKFVSDLGQLCFSPDPPVSFTNTKDRHDIAEILLNVALNTIKQTTLYIYIIMQLEPIYIVC